MPSKNYLYVKKWRKNNPTKSALSQKKYTQRKREICLQFYGGNPPKCICCGEIEIKFLAIDHINGGGTKHRKEFGVGGGNAMYLWLIRNDFPSGFQILCHNCNSAKGYYGVCPHAVLKSAQN